MLGKFQTLILTYAVSLAVLAAPMTAMAADLGSTKDDVIEEPIPVPSSFYFALRGGVVFSDSTNFDIVGANVSNSYDDVGYNFSGAIGYDMGRWFGRGFRGELELGYLESDIDSHNVGGVNFSGADASGSTSAFYGFASLYYDFSFGSRLRPYIGAGIGGAQVSFDNHSVNGAGTLLDDDDTAFAYHLSAGLNFDISPRTTLELGYRYMGFAGAELTAIDGANTDVDFDNHAIMLGLRYRM